MGERYSGPDSYGFIWNPKKDRKRAIGFLNHGDSSVAYGINNLNHVTGSGGLVDASQRVFLWSKEDGLIDLGKPDGAFAAYGTSINDYDEIVGISDPSIFETPL